MPRLSPTIEGFQAALHRPSLGFAEIAWRWSVGASAVSLFAFALIDYLDTLPVTNLDANLLATRQPPLVWRAVIDILRGSLNRATLAALFGLFALSLLWITAASVGRLAIVRALIEYCRGITLGASYNISDHYASSRDARNPASSHKFTSFWSLIGLNFLRAVGILTALLALVGSAIIVSAIIADLSPPDASPQPALGFLIFLVLAAIIAISWIGLNWLFSFASIFVVRNGHDTVGAISAALNMLSERLGPVIAVGIWNLSAHFAAFVVAAGFAAMLLVFVSIVPATLVVGGIVLVALAYFAVVDCLYVARLAGYVCITEMPEAFAQSLISPVPPAPGGERVADIPPETAVDRDEPILSDLPGLAFSACP